MNRSRLGLIAASGLGLCLAGGLASSALAQTVRRPPPAGGAPAPSANTPAPAPAPGTPPGQNAPGQPGQPGAPGQPPQGENQRQVDPEFIARMVDMRGPMTLLEQKPIQDELGISEEQIEKMKTANTTFEEKRDQLMQQMREQMRGAMAQQGGGPGGPGGFQGAPGGGFPGGPGGFPGGFPGGPGGNDQMRQMFTQMQTTMRQQSDQMLGSFLSAGQRKRFNEIVLQARGPLYVTETEMQDRLSLQPNQRMQIAAVVQEMQMKEQQLNTARRDLFRNRAGGAQGGRPGENGGQAQPGAGPNTPQRPGTPPAQEKSETEEGNAQPAAPRTDPADEGGNQRGRFTIDEETRKKMEDLQTQTEDIKKEAIQKIGKILTKRQVNNYNAMLGKKFDFNQLDMRSLMRGGFGGRGGGNFGGRGGRGG